MTIRAIFFDAVGTLLHPDPPAGVAYATVGRRFGSRYAVEDVRRRFTESFARQEALDAAAGHVTSPRREVARWRAIVGEVLDDVPDVVGCFVVLWEHFARPKSWRLEPDAGTALAALDRAGYVLGLASNFDGRLHAVRAGFPELAVLRHVVVSAEVGHRKPSADFFRELVRRTGFAPGEILLVGDDPYNDVAGARDAGLVPLPFDPAGTGDALTRLADLPRRLGVV